ncbi:MAG: acyl-CoA dehydrogenase family protein [Microthrixaceae bacterium]|nr:acyl-CoA dehydrogenase family protein [Microthrixaceae bacterium]
MGWLCSDTAELSFVDCRVPVENLVGEENTGFVQIAQNFVTERLFLAAQAYSTAQRALELTVEWCRARETFGRPLISRQTVQHTLAEMARRIDVARVYTRALALRYDAGEEDLVTTVAFAKNTAVEAGEWVVDQAVQLHGGMGYMRECEVERHYRDMRILGIGGDQRDHDRPGGEAAGLHLSAPTSNPDTASNPARPETTEQPWTSTESDEQASLRAAVAKLAAGYGPDYSIPKARRNEPLAEAVVRGRLAGLPGG